MDANALCQAPTLAPWWPVNPPLCALTLHHIPQTHIALCLAGDVKSAITKGGGKPADSGSVMFNFMRQGQVLVTGADEDELFEAAIDAGADDVQPVFDEEGQPTSDFKVGKAIGGGGRKTGTGDTDWRCSGALLCE